MAQTMTSALPIGQTFSSPPIMHPLGLFDYGRKIQTEALPAIRRALGQETPCGRSVFGLNWIQ